MGSRKRPRHPEAVTGYLGKPVPPLRQVWSIALVNREPRRWAPRGSERTRAEASARLQELLAADMEGLYDGGWMRQLWQ
jgi:hypothetical protein